MRVMRAARGPKDETIAIDRFLQDEGFTGLNAVVARRALEGAGLTRPGKIGMSSQKLERARLVLRTELLRICDRPECSSAMPGDARRVVEVSRPACDICGGSNNQGAVRRMVRACHAAGVDRVLIVGGTPRLHEALRGLLRDAVAVRFVSGLEKLPSLRDALMDCAWASLVVIWAPTPLPHKVSALYGPDVCDTDRVTVHRRGVEALAQAVADHLERTPGNRVTSR